MNTVGLGIVIVGAVVVIVWRGLAMYRQTFKRKDL
jgi:hypothetical protein